MSRALVTHIDAGCTGKRRYRSYWSSDKAARAINRNRDNARCGVYRCSSCKRWHVGNTMRKNYLKDIGVWV